MKIYQRTEINVSEISFFIYITELPYYIHLSKLEIK